MPKFKNLADMQKWLEKNVHQVVNKSRELEDVLIDAMVENVWRYVYDAYEPEFYNRREDEGGLADPRLMEITSVTLENGRVKLTFENLAQGNDSLSHTFLTDTIEEGLIYNWDNANGDWSRKRPFVAETIKDLKANPERLISALKNGLLVKGMKVR